MELNHLLLKAQGKCWIYEKLKIKHTEFSSNDNIEVLVESDGKTIFNYAYIIFFITNIKRTKAHTHNIKVAIRWYYTHNDLSNELKKYTRQNEVLLSNHYDIIDIESINQIVKIKENMY